MGGGGGGERASSQHCLDHFSLSTLPIVPYSEERWRRVFDKSLAEVVRNGSVDVFS